MPRTLRTLKPKQVTETSPKGAAPVPNGDHATVSVVSLSPPKRRRPSWVLLGVVMVGLAALVGAYVFQAVSDTVQVVVAARDLAAGEPIAEADLRVVELGRTAQLRAIQPAQQDLILGRAPTGPVPAGTVLNTGLFVPLEDVVPPGQVVIGAAFEAGAAPTATLGPGDVVVLLAAVDTTTGLTPADASTAPEASVLGRATVFAVEGVTSADSSSDRVWVSLLIDEVLQATAVQAAADARLRLALAGRSG